MLTQVMMTIQLGVGAWLDPGALGDTGGSIFHPVRREITQEYAPGNLLAQNIFWAYFLILNIPVQESSTQSKVNAYFMYCHNETSKRSIFRLTHVMYPYTVERFQGEKLLTFTCECPFCIIAGALSMFTLKNIHP